MSRHLVVLLSSVAMLSLTACAKKSDTSDAAKTGAAQNAKIIDGMTEINDIATNAQVGLPQGGFAKFDEELSKCSDWSSTDKGRYAFTGQATANAYANDATKWGQARNIAFLNATLQAQAEAAKSMNSQIESALTSSLQDNSGNTANNAASPANAAAPASAPTQLDVPTAQDLGVDSAKYNAAAPSDKQIMFTEAVRSAASVKATARTIGLVPVQSFEEVNENGVTKVGVCMVVSPTLQNYASSVLVGKTDVKPRPELKQDLAQFYRGKDNSAMLNIFGLRYAVDKEGYPVILSFTQEGVETLVGNAAIGQEKLVEAATKRASTEADAAIARFIAGVTDVSSQNTSSESYQLIKGLEGGSATENVTLMRNFQEQVQNNAKVQNFGGTLTLRTWRTIHPQTKQIIVGVVRGWSMANAKSLKILFNNANKAATAGSGGTGQTGEKLNAPAAGSITPEFRKSPIMNKIDADF